MLASGPVPRIFRLLPVVLVACAPAAAPPPAKVVVARPEPVTSASAAEPVVAEPPSYPPTSTDGLAGLEAQTWPPKKGADWVPYERPWMHTLEGAPTAFYTTTVQPDPKRKNKVQIVALDARQLELEMAPGKEGPWPRDEKTAGKWPRAGVGKLPRDPAVAKRVVVAFNGAFRLDQDAHGMMIKRRVFAPPVKNVASLLMHDDGRLGFGTWAADAQVPPDVRSYRQNLDPLLEDGVFNPHARKFWGGILNAKKTTGQRAKRSALCRTEDGNLLYFWGDAMEPTDLANAMKEVGCDYGMHLDMNPIHVGFVFMSWEDAQYKKGKSESLSPALGISDTKYIQAPNPKEFFYATLRVPVADPTFAPDGFVQPPPAFLPSVLVRTTSDVRVTRVELRRVHVEATAGNGPPLAGDSIHRVLAAFDLGAPAKADPGASLILDDLGRLGIAFGGPPSGVKWSVPVQPLIVDGVVKPGDPPIALGLTARGELLVAERVSGQASVAEALLSAGCVRAVFPSGAGRFERAGREPILSGGAGTRLYVVADRPAPATYRLDRPPR